MESQSPFLIYSASAGSGKTYTLVKAYLKILLQAKKLDHFKHILAITFTNKAAGEMKSRILEKLEDFSQTKTKEDVMLDDISKELGMEKELIREKAADLLKYIVYNYSTFHVSTIDGFTHKLIRTFAHDLKIPMDFEVEMDVNQLMSEAVDSLIAQAGTDEALTQVLIDFAIEKADDDKSWNIASDFTKMAKLLNQESDLEPLKKLENKTLDDFRNLKQLLKDKHKNLSEELVKLSQQILDYLSSNGLEHNHFYRGYFPGLLVKISKENFDVNFSAQWVEKFFNGEQLYTAKQEAHITSMIDGMHQQLVEALMKIKEGVINLKFYEALYKNMTPLSVLHAINRELKLIKTDQNKLLISEFNQLISEEIKDQPTPFIYERLGEKYHHYFIDEFQDTSVKQWGNLKPLLSNPLDTNKGSVMLVGDAKQAIYRWRGGKAEQFLDLANKEQDSPFHSQKHIANLPANFRSYQTIVEFNNGLFSFLAKGFFSHQGYAHLFNEAGQEITSKEKGFVSLEFLDFDGKEDRELDYCNRVHEIIVESLSRGYELGDLCVLVRKNKEGIAVADYLSDHQIPVISSESLLLIHSTEVSFLIRFLTWFIQPDNKEAKVDWLYYLANTKQPAHAHSFIKKMVELEDEELFEALKSFGYELDYKTMMQWPLFEMVEEVLRSFHLNRASNAYIQYFMDVVFEFSESKSSDLPAFLEYFEEKKEKLSIVTPVGQNAVQIMTIHKSKGLEFSVVIFPFADLDMYREIEAREWYPLDEKAYLGFSEGFLNFNESMKEFGDIGEEIYNRHRSEQQLDNINLLYVALTRAEQHLFVLSKHGKRKAQMDELKSYADILISYLDHLKLWNEQQLIYHFGSPERTVEEKQKTGTEVETLEFISVSRRDHQIEISTKSGMLWDSNQEKAIEKGNLVHKLMARVERKEDLDFVFSDFNEVVLDDNEKTVLLQQMMEIVEHPQLKEYFKGDHTIINERDIISTSGEMYRLDRLVLNNEKEATIIDYKTGLPKEAHDLQLNRYETVLKEMGIQTKKKILVYINEEIEVKEF